MHFISKCDRRSSLSNLIPWLLLEMRGYWAVPVLASILILGSLGFSQQALSFPVGIGGAVDTPTCDTLDMPSGTYEELGTVHPTDELISAVDLGVTLLVACPATNDGSSPNVLVSMTNLTPHTWGDVWYFGDPGTALLNNVDGIDSGINLIFKIDSVGANTPLISEDFIVDDKWQPGETWEFVIQGYSGTPGTAAEFSSLFVGTGSAAGPGPSTGSILALIDESEPPEPEEKNNPCDALDKASENGKGKKKGLERAKANNNC